MPVLMETIDNTPRYVKIGDALSQLVNVALLSRHKETTANESISGRAHRCGWTMAESVIDALFFFWEKDHCLRAHLLDIQRAETLVAASRK